MSAAFARAGDQRRRLTPLPSRSFTHGRACLRKSHLGSPRSAATRRHSTGCTTRRPSRATSIESSAWTGRPANGRGPRGYFAGHNAAHIDAIRSGIASYFARGDLTELERSVLLHHLILATNKVANITGTYGYFRKELAGPSLGDLVFEPITFERTPGAHSVVQGPVEVLGPTFVTDAVYLDPPYTKRQYAGNYHVLETLAVGDEPLAVGDGGLRPWTDQASDFCYRRLAGQAFRETLKRLNTQHVFVSYSEDGQVPEPELVSILSDFGKVRSYEQPHSRFRSNDRVRSGAVMERLYHVKAF